MKPSSNRSRAPVTHLAFATFGAPIAFAAAIALASLASCGGASSPAKATIVTAIAASPSSAPALPIAQARPLEPLRPAERPDSAIVWLHVGRPSLWRKDPDIINAAASYLFPHLPEPQAGWSSLIDDAKSIDVAIGVGSMVVSLGVRSRDRLLAFLAESARCFELTQDNQFYRFRRKDGCGGEGDDSVTCTFTSPSGAAEAICGNDAMFRDAGRWLSSHPIPSSGQETFYADVNVAPLVSMASFLAGAASDHDDSNWPPDDSAPRRSVIDDPIGDGLAFARDVRSLSATLSHDGDSTRADIDLAFERTDSRWTRLLLTKPPRFDQSELFARGTASFSHFGFSSGAPIIGAIFGEFATSREFASADRSALTSLADELGGVASRALSIANYVPTARAKRAIDEYARAHSPASKGRELHSLMSGHMVVEVDSPASVVETIATRANALYERTPSPHAGSSYPHRKTKFALRRALREHALPPGSFLVEETEYEQTNWTPGLAPGAVRFTETKSLYFFIARGKKTWIVPGNTALGDSERLLAEIARELVTDTTTTSSTSEPFDPLLGGGDIALGGGIEMPGDGASIAAMRHLLADVSSGFLPAQRAEAKSALDSMLTKPRERILFSLGTPSSRENTLRLALKCRGDVASRALGPLQAINPGQLIRALKQAKRGMTH